MITLTNAEYELLTDIASRPGGTPMSTLSSSNAFFSQKTEFDSLLEHKLVFVFDKTASLRPILEQNVSELVKLAEEAIKAGNFREASVFLDDATKSREGTYEEPLCMPTMRGTAVLNNFSKATHIIDDSIPPTAEEEHETLSKPAFSA